jgi:hypothetical protein
MWFGDLPAACGRVRAALRTGLALIAVSCVTLTIAPVALARRAARTPLPRPIPVSVSLGEGHSGAPVAQDFLGLSFEASALARLAGYAGEGNLVTMLRSLGAGVLRFGGVTSDTFVGWTGESLARPAWATEALGTENLGALGTLARVSGWHVLLTIGLGHYEPEAAASEAAAAKAALGGSLEAIELGNEPNSYAVHGLRSEPWTSVQYDEQVAVYRGAIEAAAPGIALAGPDVSGSSAFGKWGEAEVVDQRPALLTGHHYPLGCAQVPAPTIAGLLSPPIREAEAVSLQRYMAISQVGEIPFRLDETNTVSCGGVPGISNTFASALWAVGFLSQAMKMGVAGVNLEGNPTNCAGYTPLCATTPETLAAGELSAQPEWYALLLLKALIGERPLRTITSAPTHPDIEVQTFRASDGALHFVVVDDDPPGSRNLALALHIGSGFHGASVLSLTAPSPAALSGVKLGGQAVASDGSWTPPSSLPHAANQDGAITVSVAPSSAALLTVSPIGRSPG